MAALALTACTRQLPAAAVFDVRSLGASGFAADNATAIIQKALDLAAVSGGTVIVPAGDYTVGTLIMGSRTTLELQAGATLWMSADPAQFKTPTQQPGTAKQALIFARGVRDITIRGLGRLAARPTYEWREGRGSDVDAERALAVAAGIEGKLWARTSNAAHMVLLLDSENIHIEGITIADSPIWGMRLWGCRSVFIRGVTVHSDLEKAVNSDGIDIDSSRDVFISDSRVSTADDAICLKTTAMDAATMNRPAGDPALAARPTENIIVRGVLLTSSSSAFKIGSETRADVRHVVFADSVIENSNRGFGIQLLDGATVSDVRVSNITMTLSRRHWNWWGNAEAIGLFVRPRKPGGKVGRIEGVTLSGISAHARGTSQIIGHAQSPIRDLRIDNMHLTMHREGTPDERSTDALALSQVERTILSQSTIRWEGVPQSRWGHGIVVRDSRDINLDRVTAAPGNPQSATVSFQNVDTATLRACRALPSTGPFLELLGGTTAITLRDNDLRLAAPLRLGDGVPQPNTR